ncbi:MAG: protein ImuA, partial [Bradyrhizobium sp.]|nr:protein ImuA [Bradyrhizobium sp.]
MTSARTNTLASLRDSIERIEAPGDAYMPGRVALGHAEADVMLQGGLALGAVHEVFADAGRQSAAATGFVAGLAGRVAARRPLVWVRQDFTEIESGALSMSGLAELGLDPRLVVTVRAADVDTALRTAADAFACDAIGAVVLEVWGEARQLDLVASRKLTLAAQASGVTGLVLRMAAEPLPSTAETRWIVRAAHSPPLASAWGAPMFDA